MPRSVLLRSMLYIPANGWRMVMNGLSGMQDAVILDLEDAVPMGEKETGRILARDAIPMFKETGFDVFVRTNSRATRLVEHDIEKVVVEGLDGIVLPKADTDADIVWLDQLLDMEEEKKGLAKGDIDIVALVESPRGVENAFRIAGASHRVTGIAFGAGDFLREMGTGFAVTQLSAEAYYPLLLYARSRLAQAARSNQVEAIDTPYFGLLIDLKGLRWEADRVKLLGFTGKQLIHPRHIQAVNETFSPSGSEAAYAQSIVRAYEEAKLQGLGAASFGGRMIDQAMYRMGQDMLAKVEAIVRKSGAGSNKEF